MTTDTRKHDAKERERGEVRRVLAMRFLGAAAILGLLGLGGLASADNVANDVLQTDGRTTHVAPGDTVVVRYWLSATGFGNDGQQGCNAADLTPAQVSVHAPAGVTLTPPTLTFNACGPAASQPVSFTATAAGNHSITASVTDGGVGTYDARQATWYLNATAPIVEAVNTPPTLQLPANMEVVATGASGAQATFVVGADDAEDGPLANATCSPASGSLFAPGTTVVSCTVTDSGNLTDSGSFTLRVSFAKSGFHEPVTMATLNSVKGGSTVPLKFTVTDGGSGYIRDTGIVTSIRTNKLLTCPQNLETDPMLSGELAATADTGQTTLRYDTVAEQFIQNWKTPKPSTTTCYRVEATFTDGSTLRALFEVRK